MSLLLQALFTKGKGSQGEQFVAPSFSCARAYLPTAIAGFVY
jgi:hypothetical protein